MMMHPDIKELSKTELDQWIARHGMRPFRAAQILRWLYVKHAAGFADMTDISKTDRIKLSENFSFSAPRIRNVEASADGSRKYLFELNDGRCIETVLIPEKDHFTLCISTQVGCAMGCRFCMTAQSGLIRNLTQGEILGQVLGVLPDVGAEKRLTNIVLMGMGEPLANYDAVVRALSIATNADWGLGFSNRRVTLSTSGLIPRFADLARDTRVNLAVSLNAADDETRSFLMPINRKYPLADLIAACAGYPLAPRCKITFEYILIRDINDSDAAARRLAKLLRPVKAKINLIPFNEHPASEFKRPEESRILEFQEILAQKQYTAVVRHSKGRDISAACGQLSAQHPSPQ